jgi:hypothetical protein
MGHHQDRRFKRPVINARKLDRPADGGMHPGFSYYVVKTSYAAMARDAGDHRQVHRHRTRLRSGKVLDPCNGFLSDCQIYDRSERGARIRLTRDIPVPGTFRLYEDWPESLNEANVIWRKDRELGLRFNLAAQPRRISRSQLASLRGRFYAPRG